jgi:hypothetical protein
MPPVRAMSASWRSAITTGSASGSCRPGRQFASQLAFDGWQVAIGVGELGGDRAGAVNDVGLTTVWLCPSDTISGQTIVVDGGMLGAMHFG